MSDDGAYRLYNVLAYFDTRDGSEMADLVRSAREGWERSGPIMGEPGAWAEFDARWDRRSDSLGKRGTRCVTADCGNPATCLMTCEGEGAYPYCNECEANLAPYERHVGSVG